MTTHTAVAKVRCTNSALVRRQSESVLGITTETVDLASLLPSGAKWGLDVEGFF